jgi:hypothetical protein
MTLYARVLPWWCGVLLIIGFPLADYVLDILLLVGVSLGDYFLFYVAPAIENFVFVVVWGLIGYALLARRGTVASQPSHGN